jgi:LuxR family maltose regulon positive regulatory protein
VSGAASLGDAALLSRPAKDGRGQLIERPALLAKFDWVRRGRVLIVQAPGGYGKSQMLASWTRRLRADGGTVIRPRLDDSVTDPTSFLTALHAACLRSVPGCALIEQAQGAAPTSATVRASVRRLATALRSASPPVIIMLNDYDRVATGEIDALLSELVSADGDGIHWVLVSRTQVKVPFGTLWFEANVAELDRRDLRFTDAEIAAVFDNRLCAADLARISVWTEGWPVAVQLVRHHLDGRRGDHHELDRLLEQAQGDVARYLTEQVLHGLPPEQRELLVLSSFLAEFSVELVESVTGIRPAWHILQALQNSNVLIAPRDEDDSGGAGWFRCHQLLRSVMFEQLCRRGRANLASLHHRAARWFRDNGRLQDALHHAVASGDIALAAQLILDVGAIFFCIRYGAPALRALMNYLPPDVVAHHPRLGLAQVALLIKEGRMDVAKDLLRSLRPHCTAALALRPDTLLSRDLAMAELTVSAYTGERAPQDAVATLEASLLDCQAESFWFNGILHNILCNTRFRASDFVGALAAADTAQFYYALAQSSNGTGHIHLHVGMISLAMGNPLEALRHFRTAHGAFRGGTCGDDGGCALADVLTAEALYDQGRLDEARALCGDALTAVEGGEHHLDTLISGYRTLTALVAEQQGARAALQVTARGLAFARRRRFVELEQYLNFRRLELQMDDADPGVPACDLSAVAGAPISWPAQDLQALVQARLSLQLGERADALAALDDQQQRLGVSGRLRMQVKVLVLLACGCDAAGQRAVAMQHLSAALALALPGELVMPFVELGRQAVPLLAHLVAAGGAPGPDSQTSRFALRILRVGTPAGMAVASVFSFRELEIVRLLVDGASNKAIARLLSISPETVRFHLKNVYEKFGVSDRRVVAAMAGERGLLEDM